MPGVHGGFVDGPGASGGLLGGGTGGFHEEDHPRDAEGKFAPGAGGDDSGASGGGSGQGGSGHGPEGTSKGARADGKPLTEGQKAAKSLAGRPGMSPATPDSLAAMKEERGIAVPPGWADVQLADDPNSACQAVGLDAEGRTQPKMSAAHTAQAKVEKHERCRIFYTVVPSIEYRAQEDMGGTGKSREDAACLLLIKHTGARVGGDEAKSKGQKTYGASTLEARHVTIEGATARLDFIGKTGKRNVYEVTEPHLVADLEARKAAAESDDARLYDTSDDRLRRYLKTAAGGQEFKVHDFRTRVATMTAYKAAEGMEVPKTPEAFWKQWDEVGEIAAARINDERAVALDTYVDPKVFFAWRNAAGVGEDDARPKRKAKS